MTVRMASCRELPTNIPVVNKLQQDFWMLENKPDTDGPSAALVP